MSMGVFFFWAEKTMAVTVDELITEYRANISDYESKARRVIQINREIDQSTVGTTASLNRMNIAIHAIAAATNTINGLVEIFNRLGDAVRRPFDAAVRFDRLMLALETVAGSASEARKQFERLKVVAQAPGLGLEEAIQGSVRLQSAGFSARTAERALKSFGNALAIVGRGRAELDGVTIALTQIANKTQVSAEEINQLAERLPQIRRAMQAAFGTSSTEALQKMGVQPMFFIERIIEQFEKLKPLSGSISNDMENLGDKFTIAFASAGRILLPFAREILPQISKLLDQITPMLDKLAAATEAMGKGGGLKAFAATLVGDFQRLNFIISTTVGLFAGLAAGSVVVGLFKLVAVFKQLYETIKGIGLASFVISGISRNYVGIFAGLAALAAGVAAFKATDESLKKAWAESPSAGMGKINGSETPTQAMQKAMSGIGAATGTAPTSTSGGLSSSQYIEMVNTFLTNNLPGIISAFNNRPAKLTAGGVDAAVSSQRRADEVARLIAASPEWMKATWSHKAIDPLMQIERNTKAAALGLQNLAAALFGGGPRASLGLSLADVGPQSPAGRRGQSPGGTIKIDAGSAVSEFERVAQRLITDTVESLARQGLLASPAIGGRIV